MDQVIADGILRHRFHGEYSAVIGLQFASEAAANDALTVLGGDWKQGDTSKNVLVWVGDSTALEACKVVLGGYGADVKKIDSIARSIDYGEPFKVTIPIQAPKEQMTLPI